MKKSVFKKLILFVLTMALLIGSVVCVAAAANSDDDQTYAIKAVNVSYGDRFNVLIAVDTAGDDVSNVEVSYTIGKKEYTATLWEDYFYTVDGVDYPVFYTVGIAAKDCGESVVIEAHKVGAREYTPQYREVSVASYLAKRLYADGFITKTEGTDGERRALYQSCLEYIASAQEVLWNYVQEGDQRVLVTDRVFIGAKDGYVNDVRSSFGEIRREGATVTVNYLGEGAKPDGWYAYYADGSSNLYLTDYLPATESCYLEPYFDASAGNITFESSTVGDGLWVVGNEKAYTHNTSGAMITATAYAALSAEEQANYTDTGKYVSSTVTTTVGGVNTVGTPGEQITTTLNDYITLSTEQNAIDTNTGNGRIATPNGSLRIKEDTLGKKYFHFYTPSKSDTVYKQKDDARPIKAVFTVRDDASVPEYNVTIFEFEAIFNSDCSGTLAQISFFRQNGKISSYPYIRSSGSIDFTESGGTGSMGVAKEGCPVTVRYEYYHDTGALRLYIDGRYQGESTKTYSDFASGKITSIGWGCDSGASADISFYSIKAVNTYKEYDATPGTISGPVYETLDSDFYMGLIDSWECTRTEHTDQFNEGGIFAEGGKYYGYKMPDGTLLTPKYQFKTEKRLYGAFTSVYYSSDSGSNSNVHGATAEYLTDPLTGRKYVEFYSPTRISTRDRAYNLNVARQDIVPYGTENFVYVLDFDFRILNTRNDEALELKPFSMIFESTTGSTRTPMQMDFTVNNSEEVIFNGAKLGEWNEWNSVRFEIYPLETTARIKVYTKNVYGEYEYVYTFTNTNSTQYPLANLSLATNGVTSVSIGNNEHSCVALDNVAFYTDVRDEGYDTSNEINFLYNSNNFVADFDKAEVNGLQSYISEFTGKVVNANKNGADMPDVGNLIIVGDVDNSYTSTAKDILSSSMANPETDIGYIIYPAENNRTVIYWNDFRLADKAIADFTTNYMKDGEILFAKAEKKIYTNELVAYLSEREETVLTEAWAEFGEALLAEGATEEQKDAIVTELQEYYGGINYDEAIKWIAALYDPDLGAWHRSPSGRDNIGYYPNIESTVYGLRNFFGMTGELYGGKWGEAVPEEVLQKAATWVQGLQREEDGYFINPGWVGDSINLRLTRDVTSAKEILDTAGLTPTYAYPGTSRAATSSGTYLLGHLGTSTAVATSRVVAVTDSQEGIGTAVETDEGFKAYLTKCAESICTLDENGQVARDENGKIKFKEDVTDASLADNFYTWGSNCQSVVGRIEASEVRKQYAIEFFNTFQNPNTGVWTVTDDGYNYDCANAIHKISSVYTRLGAELQYTDKMVDTNFKVLAMVGDNDSTTPAPDNTCEIYNIWSNFSYIYDNIRGAGAGTTEEKEAKVAEIKKLVYEGAAKAIDSSRVEAMKYGKDEDENGKFYSFSTDMEYSASDAYGYPTGVPGTKEGDIDGFLFAAIDIPRFIFKALDLSDYEVPYFTEEDRVAYIYALENAPSIDRTQDPVLYDFDDVKGGEVPSGITVGVASNKNQNPGTSIEVIAESEENKALKFVMNKQSEADLANDKGRNPSATIQASHTDDIPTVASISMKVKITSTNVGIGGGTLNIYLANAATPIQATIRVDGNDVYFYETKGTRVGKIGTKGEWFEFAIDYNWGEGTYTVYTVAEDGTKTRVGQGTSTTTGVEHQLVSKLTIGSDSNVVAEYYIDDLQFYTYDATKVAE